jgi:hypothetical protein
LEDVDGHIVPVSDLLPADEQIGEEGSGVGHTSALKGVGGTSVGLFPIRAFEALMPIN